ncbi:DUF4134 domain-containing protein [uncultured Pedobacter sp.]|uniref:DUF4134 domain-containing protein n=1 Tax=uncultured Pedobacter sp. TaxID=246139 RepID=UPI002625F11F|nr:DUF4134 domain-containing protein [uncultured Pedobacter sp.]
MKKIRKINTCQVLAKGLLLTGLMLAVATLGHAQNGNAGIDAANSEVRSYFNSGTQLMYAIGAILGLIGAIKVYQKWNNGDQDTSKVASAWFGSCVFLVIVATVIRSFFGI